jgi:hypothetical protein
MEVQIFPLNIKLIRNFTVMTSALENVCSSKENVFLIYSQGQYVVELLESRSAGNCNSARGNIFVTDN